MDLAVAKYWRGGVTGTKNNQDSFKFLETCFLKVETKHSLFSIVDYVTVSASCAS